MLKVLGSSSATKAQCKKYFESRKITDRDYLIDLYMQHAATYNVEYELALGMALIFTDFFKNPIEDNNLCGIGKQFSGRKFEKFDSEEDCIKAQLQLLRIGADYHYKPDELLSVAAKNLMDDKTDAKGLKDILRGNINTITLVYDLWNYKKFTHYTLEDLWRIARDINIIRSNKKYYDTKRSKYFFVVVGTATRKEALYNMKRDLLKLGFKESAISVDNGFYRLEIGKVDSEKEAAIIRINLSIFGYSGTVKYREILDEQQNIIQGTRE